MAEIIHRVGIQASPDKVFRALSTIEGLAGWWTANTSGVSDVGKTIEFQFRDPNGEIKGEFDMEVLKQEPFKRVQWKCEKGPAEWIGTEITFDLKQENEFTIVLFAHRKWRESVEFTAHCSAKWGVFLMSLKEFIETGKGKPAPRDVKIDNWKLTRTRFYREREYAPARALQRAATVEHDVMTSEGHVFIASVQWLGTRDDVQD